MNVRLCCEKQRRVQQFAQVFEPMHHRTVNVVKDCCFLRIEERENRWSTKRALEASRVTEKFLSKRCYRYAGRILRDDPDIEGWSDDGCAKGR